jgi:flagellar FliJ protein
MKAFRFSLEPVLSYRRQIEDLRRREFALAHRAAQEQQRALLHLYGEEARAKEELREIERRLDLPEVLAQRRFLAGLARRIQHGRDLHRQRSESQARARAAYVEARRARRVLERLRERRLAEWSLLGAREEQKLMDEIAACGRRLGGVEWSA